MSKLNPETCRILLDEFLQKWSYEDVRKMTINDYVLGGKNTKESFSYWIEDRTHMLGGIGGWGGGGSFKHGIFIQKNFHKFSKDSVYTTDGKYAWRKKLGNTPAEAFKKIKDGILKIIAYTQNAKFDKIDEVEDIFAGVRWKIAYLYSNRRLSPMFQLALLRKIAKHYGMKKYEKAMHSELQIYIMRHRPNNVNVYEWSDEMWTKFGPKKRIGISDAEAVIEGFEGNKKKGKAHIYKERDNKFRTKYRKTYSGTVKCPACNFDPQKKYSLKDPNRFLELHHIIPLKFVETKTKISADDVTLLCPNCHRAIHKMMSKENLKKITLLDFKKRLKKKAA
ncbi:MAG: hypothetical protein EHM58_00135 [Ignavibacteriae bacterium]|nr:MAG: hypothetical protein EHM58_00135 [Ignavibacteriota bacterium]